MKKNFQTRIHLALCVLLLALLLCVAFSSIVLSSSEPEINVFPENYDLDGSHSSDPSSSSYSGVKTGINMAEGDPTLLNHSEIINVVIFIYFADEAEASVLPAATTDSVISSFNGNTLSLFDYYRTISYGSFTVRSIAPQDGTVVFAYKDSQTRSYYNRVSAQSGTSRYNPESTLLNNAVAAADDYFDYRGVNLDANRDNYVDSVSFVVSGTYSSDAWGKLMWPHAWNLNKITGLSSSKGNSSTLNGLYVDNYTFTFAGSFQIGLVAHEFGHLLGLTDYYHYGTDTNSNRLPVGYWDLMHLDAVLPQFMLSYTRDSYLGFLDKKQIVELTANGTYSLIPTAMSQKTDVVAYKITLNEYESIWMEYRLNAPYLYDRGLPSSGLLLYRINTKAHGNTDGKYQNPRYPDEVYVYRPEVDVSSISGLKAQELYRLGRATLNFSESGRSSVGSHTITTKYSSDCLYLTDGTNTGITVTLNSIDDSRLTFTVDLGSYDGSYIGDSYVIGKTIDEKPARNESYIYYGETPELDVYVKYTSRPSAIKLSDYDLIYENRVCPEGQQAYVVFIDSSGERRIPFTLYIYDVVKMNAVVDSPPDKTTLAVGEPLDLTGLSVTIEYLSGRTETVAYSDANKSQWTITDGLDINRSGVYNAVTVRYGEKVYFTLSGITVHSDLISMRVLETDTTHLSGKNFIPHFNVIGSFEDGTVRALSEREYTAEIPQSQAFERLIVPIVSTENPSVRASSYVYNIGNETATEIKILSQPERLSVPYGTEPSFTGSSLSVTFSDGKSLTGDNALPLENYSSVLMRTYSPISTGEQTLTASIGSISFSVKITVLSQTDSILRRKDEATYCVLNEAKSRILLTKDCSLPELTDAFASYLRIVLKDAESDAELLPSAYTTRKAGANLYLELQTESGIRVKTYAVYRLGDCNGDGMVSDEDKEGWTEALLRDETFSKPQLDVTGDGKYTLTDFVLLVRGEE